jgi:Fe-S-cluster formation regulator IscX/YfhJ
MSDRTKPRISLVPLVGLARAARIMAKGLCDGRKEGDWQTMRREDFVNGLMRHVIALQDGDDSEDHLGAVIANALIAAWYDAHQD